MDHRGSSWIIRVWHRCHGRQRKCWEYPCLTRDDPGLSSRANPGEFQCLQWITPKNRFSQALGRRSTRGFKGWEVRVRTLQLRHASIPSLQQSIHTGYIIIMRSIDVSTRPAVRAARASARPVSVKAICNALAFKVTLKTPSGGSVRATSTRV